MTNVATVQRDVINFQNGIAYEFALKYPTGKVVSNGRVMFSTTDGEVFFIDQADADKIYDLDLRPQERFKLLKSRVGIVVERIPHTQSRSNGQQQPETISQKPSPAAAYTTVDPGDAPQLPQTHGNNSLSSLMASSYISAIDALMIAEQYAQSKGLTFKITSGEVRSSAHCIYISLTRNLNGVTR